ncbi:hypothetical protein TeGR_g15277, partial [Tetraparma gracilis]
MPAAANSTHNVPTTKSVDSTSENTVKLTVNPRDRFGNTILDATGYNVSVSGGAPEELLPPDYSYTHPIQFGSFDDLSLNFTLNGAEIAGSPITVPVNPSSAIYLGATVATLLLVLFVGNILYKIISRRKAGLRQQRRELRRQKMDLEQLERQDQDIQEVRKSQSKLKARKEELEEEVRLKKHSEEELKVMVAALESVSKERQDELKEVMIDSSELKIDKLLGKGGFGVVNLATYKGGKVAMKQLLTVNEENVLRFRHECFLMKNLSHPNVVQLVGVCWSEDLFACCLEFVENGSLEDWLRKTVGGKVYHRPKTPVIGKRKVKEEEGVSLAAVRIESLFCMVVKEAPGTEGERSEVWRMSLSNFKFAMGFGFVNQIAATKTAELIAAPLELLKLNVERLLKEYKPPEHVVEELDLTWKGGLWRMALEAALGVQYLHHHRYWSDGGKRHNGTTNEIEEEEAGWKESVIHRDLKPDNMLLTRDWTLKLTDFGEARAQNMGGTMTSVGTPIYIAPEVMRADHYDAKADTWSFGLYYYSEGWRPILPIAFVKAYPKLHTLIQECWRVRRKERPNFDEIVKRLQGDIGDEIKRKEEPKIELYSKEDDLVYRNRIGKEDEIEDSDEEESGTKRGEVVSKAEHARAVAAVAAKDKMLREMVDKAKQEMDVMKKRAAAKEKRAEVEMKKVERELEKKTAEVGRWGTALQELKLGSPE